MTDPYQYYQPHYQLPEQPQQSPYVAPVPPPTIERYEFAVCSHCGLHIVQEDQMITMAAGKAGWNIYTRQPEMVADNGIEGTMQLVKVHLDCVLEWIKENWFDDGDFIPTSCPHCGVNLEED